MPSQSPIPPLLSSHLAVPPESSLTILTSVLGASSNWLLLRYLYSALTSRKGTNASDNSEREIKVVLVSWLRDLTFWKEGTKRLGIDLSKSFRFTFIDGLGTSLGLGSGAIEDVEKAVIGAVSKEDGSRALVVLDGIDFLLAATETSVGEVLDFIGELREVGCFWTL